MNVHRTLQTLAVLALGGLAFADQAKAPPRPGGPNDAELVERVVAARKEYQQSLVALFEHYAKSGDRERAKWAEDELKAFHLTWKPSYRLDILDVPPPSLEAKVNVKEANELYRQAMLYKDKGFGTDYTLNQRRAELLLQEVLQKYPNCDKIADVAYQLGDLYEGRAYKQYDRAAAYFERAAQWRKGSGTDALLRAARLYDRSLNERGKAIELYRQVIETDTDAARIAEATRRRDELTSRK
jgi:tetratricopeptide (TPR) repeat protein